MNHLTRSWLIILPSLSFHFQPAVFFHPLRIISRKATGKCRHGSTFYLGHTSVAGVVLGTWHALVDIILSGSVQV